MTTISGSTLNSLPSATSSVVQDNYLDQNSLNSVKTLGRHNDPAALKEISKKFEAMFVQQMLKSMRDANEVFADGDMFSSQEVKFHQEMMDQQMVLNLTGGQGIGLARSMYQQMQKAYGKSADQSKPNEPQKAQDKPVRTPTVEQLMKPLSFLESQVQTSAGKKSAMAESPADFIAKVKPYAEKAAAELNVGVDVLLAQAALETGWGKHLIHDANGSNTFNLFNIKSTGGWQGKSVSVNTLENINGVAQQERSSFRQYSSVAQSFSDYVGLIKNSPRYQKALAVSADSNKYAEALQQAGYATDPRYAEKIKQLMNSDHIRNAVQTSKQLVDVMTGSIRGDSV